MLIKLSLRNLLVSKKKLIKNSPLLNMMTYKPDRPSNPGRPTSLVSTMERARRYLEATPENNSNDFVAGLVRDYSEVITCVTRLRAQETYEMVKNDFLEENLEENPTFTTFNHTTKLLDYLQSLSPTESYLLFLDEEFLDEKTPYGARDIGDLGLPTIREKTPNLAIVVLSENKETSGHKAHSFGVDKVLSIPYILGEEKGMC